MGRKNRKGRPITGIVLLDKPAGMTSNKALQIVKRIYNANKAGHTGSLDPFATGLLPICFGDATKVSSFLLDADKTYEVVCKLGQKTDTADLDGEIIEEREVPDISPEKLNSVISDFIGEISQIPPMYSALKKDGKRLYELARKGIEVEREARDITIHSIENISLEGNNLSLTVSCSKGTYVRTLMEDIAEKLGTCGHLITLRRTGLFPFDGDRMTTLHEIDSISDNGFERLDSNILGADVALTHFPNVNLTKEMTSKFCHGNPVSLPFPFISGLVRVYGDNEDFIGVGEADSFGNVNPKRVFSSFSK